MFFYKMFFLFDDLFLLPDLILFVNGNDEILVTNPAFIRFRSTNVSREVFSIRNSFFSNVFKLWVFCRYWYVTFWNRENVAFAAVVGGKRWRRHVWNIKCVVFSSLQIPMHPNLFWSRNTVKNATYTKLSSIPTVRELAFTYAQK